jgi:hypothetical protein
MMSFYDNLVRICDLRGTKPTPLLQKMGLSTSKGTAWKNGSLPTQDMMVRLAQELNCSVMDFFADDDELFAEQRDQQELDDDEKELVRIFRSLDRRSKHEFMSTAYDFERRIIKEGSNEAI